MLIGILLLIALMILGIVMAWAASIRARRVAALPEVAAKAGLQFAEVDVFNTTAVPFELFRVGDGREVTNLMWVKEDDGRVSRVFDYAYYVEQRTDNGQTTKSWHRFTCALVQHNGKWPEIHITRERVLDRALQKIGLPDIELESGEFNRTFVVQCEDRKFATDLIDPQMMEFLLGSEGKIDFVTKGRFLLLTASQLPAELMPGLLGMARQFVKRVPPLVWELYGRFPPGAGTEHMPLMQERARDAESSSVFGFGDVHDDYERGVSYDFAPPPDLHRSQDAWDPTPDVEHDLDGQVIEPTQEDPWGDGRPPPAPDP